uniref:PLAT domain-containing protein n=1 Tax=Nothoprocta perdicaria TaxID=30464 RepID=A0A8C6YZ19_NOTPE
LPSMCFLVTLYTGSRFGAGTTADVSLQLIGWGGTSEVHCLRQPHCSSFRQGSIDTFWLTICALRVWHNNQGSLLPSIELSPDVLFPFISRGCISEARRRNPHRLAARGLALFLASLPLNRCSCPTGSGLVPCS